jgi:hypothetical protein
MAWERFCLILKDGPPLWRSHGLLQLTE